MTHHTPAESNQCPCGEPGTIYADDERTPLCGRCALKAMGISVEVSDG